MSDSRPIGVFDSGLGGLTVVKQLLRLMPGETIYYLGDTARCPYGGRSVETIRQFGLQDALFLLSKDIKVLVVACNTVSAVALEHIRKHVDELPVIGVVVPGARAAVLRTAEKKIGVIGTRATVQTQAYVTAIRAIDKNIRVIARACPLFVPIVEEGLRDSEIARLTAQYYLYELVDSGIDCLILGCTHYPLLMGVIIETIGTRIQVIDSSLWTAKETQDILATMDLLNPLKTGGLENSQFFVTDTAPNFEENATLFLGSRLSKVQKISLEELNSQQFV